MCDRISDVYGSGTVRPVFLPEDRAEADPEGRERDVQVRRADGHHGAIRSG